MLYPTELRGQNYASQIKRQRTIAQKIKEAKVRKGAGPKKAVQLLLGQEAAR